MVDKGWALLQLQYFMRVRALQVDVYSFAMILFQLFEHMPPFAGVDPVEAAKAAALDNKRPKLERLNSSQSPMPVSLLPAYLKMRNPRDLLAPKDK